MARETSYSVENRAQTMTEVEYRNMQGKLYHVDESKQASDSGGLDVTLTTGDKPVRLFLDVGSTGAFTYELFEDQGGLDVNDDGSSVNVKTLNRVKSNGISVMWQREPTVNSTGTEIIQTKSSGTKGSKGNQDSVPGAANGGLTRILKANTQYLFRITDRTTDNNTDLITFTANFWETDYNMSK